MKKLFAILILVLTLGFNAQGAELKIGFVDLNKALNESDKGKNATEILENMIKTKQSVLLEKETELKKMDEELKKQASVLSPESMKSKKDEFSKVYRNFQRMVKDIQEEVQKKEVELRQQIQRDLIEIVHKIGEEEGFHVILERGGILHAKKEIDLTDKLIKRYNKISKNKQPE
jgi:outer membrane protein